MFTYIRLFSIGLIKHFFFRHRVNIPDIYKSTYGEICRADATAIDLGKLNKYYYEFGRYVAAFDRNGFVGKIIYEVCMALSNVAVKILIYFRLYSFAPR